MTRGAWVTGLALCLLSHGPAAIAQAEKTSQPDKAAAPSPLQVTIERLGNFSYAGDAVLVRLAVFNTGKVPYDNSKGLDLRGNLLVADKIGAALKHRSAPGSEPRSQPAVLAPGEFFGMIADLRDIVDGIDVPGTFVARYQGPGFASDAVELVVISRYDPVTAYRATIETDYGTLLLDLFGKQAPAHVHNFYDLGNQGYYDGTLFHFVAKGIELRGGDRTGNGESSPGYSLQPEIDESLKHVRGSMSMLRGDSSDHGSQFLISLATNPSLDGRLTIFGTLAGGDETLQALENLPTYGQKSYPFYRPLKDARIRSIRVTAAPAGSKATAEGVPAKSPSKP